MPATFRIRGALRGQEEPMADDGTVVLSGEEEDLSILIAQLEKD
jgi:hypothetical protein